MNKMFWYLRILNFSQIEYETMFLNIYKMSDFYS